MRRSTATLEEYKRSSHEIESTRNGHPFVATDAEQASTLAADTTMHRSLDVKVRTLAAEAI